MIHARIHRTAGQSRGGFTLVELMAVVAIIALLIGISIPAVMYAQRAAAIAAAQQQMASIKFALNTYEGDFDAFPPSDHNKLGSGFNGDWGSEILAKLLVGYGDDDTPWDQKDGFGIKRQGVEYGPYLTVDEKDLSEIDIAGTRRTMLTTPWGTGIYYYLANLGSLPTAGSDLYLWNIGTNYRYDYTDNCTTTNKYPDWHNYINNPDIFNTNDDDYDENVADLAHRLMTGKYLLYDLGPNNQAGDKDKQEDDLIMTGP